MPHGARGGLRRGGLGRRAGFGARRTGTARRRPLLRGTGRLRRGQATRGIPSGGRPLGARTGHIGGPTVASRNPAVRRSGGRFLSSHRK